MRLSLRLAFSSSLPGLRQSAALSRSRNPHRAYVTRAALCANVLHLGRKSGKDAIYDAPVETYITRMRSSLRVEERWLRSDAAVAEAHRLAERTPVVLLHEAGPIPRSSVHFSELLYDRLQRGGSRVTFVIGDDDGIPSELLSASTSSASPNIETLSLSTLTFTHKMVRCLSNCVFVHSAKQTSAAALWSRSSDFAISSRRVRFVSFLLSSFTARPRFEQTPNIIASLII